jgi:glycosyltransferase involved in cell wall biosynthesis
MSDGEKFELSVIVPARNEAECLRECLTSLTAQSGDGFLLGKDWELIVVNDGSTDATREIAASFDGVTVLDAPELPKGWTGKNHAVWLGAQASSGRWILFTDADTVHEPGNLIRAMGEARKYGAAMLSYSPRQLVSGVVQRTVMPLVFSELAAVYRPKDVSNPAKRIAAANGQFLMVEREAYFSIGGHKVVADSVLEDVELAMRMKRSKAWDANGVITGTARVVRFRYAPDAVTARMYRSFGQMVEGWTKNLALLFPQPLALAVWRMIDLALLVGLPLIAACLWLSPVMAMWWSPTIIVLLWVVVALLWARTVARVYMRIAKSNFPWSDCVMAPLGIPVFSWLLWRSWTRHTFGKRVGWKGRTYPVK